MKFFLIGCGKFLKMISLPMQQVNNKNITRGNTTIMIINVCSYMCASS